MRDYDVYEVVYQIMKFLAPLSGFSALGCVHIEEKFIDFYKTFTVE